jgi:hypothetical protein
VTQNRENRNGHDDKIIPSSNWHMYWALSLISFWLQEHNDSKKDFCFRHETKLEYYSVMLVDGASVFLRRWALPRPFLYLPLFFHNKKMVVFYFQLATTESEHVSVTLCFNKQKKKSYGQYPVSVLNSIHVSGVFSRLLLVYDHLICMWQRIVCDMYRWFYTYLLTYGT